MRDAVCSQWAGSPQCARRPVLASAVVSGVRCQCGVRLQVHVRMTYGEFTHLCKALSEVIIKLTVLYF